jgi:cytochrome c556
MRVRDRKSACVIAIAIMTVSGGFAAAQQQSPAQIVKARQDNLKALGGAMKTVGDQLKSGAPDKAAVGAAAQKIDDLAKALPGWFPAGSGPEAGVKTAAKPEIWTQPADFKAASDKLIAEAGTLVEVAASGDAAAIGGQLRATGKACGACHKQFRVPDEEH